MSDEQIENQINNSERPPEVDLESLKLLYDYYAVTHQVLTQKCTFHVEEFDFIGKVVKFHESQMLELRSRIVALEPKKEELDGSSKE